jgi:hypothetical protein
MRFTLAAVTALWIGGAQAVAVDCVAFKRNVSIYGIDMVRAGALARGYTEADLQYALKKCAIKQKGESK